MSDHINDTREAVLDAPATAPDSIDSWARYNNRSKPMLPERIYAVWKRSAGEPWVLYEVVVRGRLIKKNGQVGVAPETSEFVKWGRQSRDMPAWVLTAINSIQPEGDW